MGCCGFVRVYVWLVIGFLLLRLVWVVVIYFVGLCMSVVFLAIGLCCLG